VRLTLAGALRSSYGDLESSRLRLDIFEPYYSFILAPGVLDIPIENVRKVAAKRRPLHLDLEDRGERAGVGIPNAFPFALSCERRMDLCVKVPANSNELSFKDQINRTPPTEKRLRIRRAHPTISSLRYPQKCVNPAIDRKDV
jgi:hypothetical protein